MSPASIATSNETNAIVVSKSVLPSRVKPRARKKCGTRTDSVKVGRDAVVDDAYMRTAKVSALFSGSAGALYGVAGIEPSEDVLQLMMAIPTLAVVLWLERAVNRTAHGVILDLGLFLWNGWAIAIPWFAFKTRGRSGWRLVVLLFALILSPYLGTLGGWLVALPLRYIN